MKRRKAAILLAAVFLIGLPVLTKAAEERSTSIKSSGNIVYKSSAGSVELYAEDIALLQERLASVPDEIFSPILYSHSHDWEYIDITSKEHTKHCAGCGSSHDMIGPHQASTVSSCIISYDGEEYIGDKKICECGYEWEEEVSHNLIYETKDESYHMMACVLSGTVYCSGMESMEEKHSMMFCAIDESHHQESCTECGFTGKEEECTFDIEEKEEIEEGEESKDSEEVKKYCKCGNYIIELSDGGDEPVPEVTDPDEEGNEIDQPDPEETEVEESQDVVSEGGIL